MILIDYSQACIAAIMVMNENPKKIDIDIIRHVVLNMIRSYKRKYGKDYGEMVICTDSKNNWRKQNFPLYKAKRNIDRTKSPYNWEMIFKSIAQIKSELREYFPFRVLEVEGAEADDIIAAICHAKAPTTDILIISSDTDFLQLQRYPRVKQFSPHANKYISTDNPSRFLKEHILTGDRADGVPNFLSPDDCLVTGQRQKPISQKKLALWLDSNPEDFCDNVMLARYNRNKELIDLWSIPLEVRNAVMIDYKTVPQPYDYKKLTEFFMEKDLVNLFDHIGEFK